MVYMGVIIMYNFGTLVQILLAVITLYVTLYFSLKEHATNNKLFCKQRKTLNIVTFLTLYLSIFLYLIPSLIKFINLLRNTLLNNSNFMISYITEAIFSIIAFCISFRFLLEEYNFSEKHNIIIIIMIFILIEIGLLWMNFYLSLFISNNSILKGNSYFIFSIIFNGLIYFVIFCLITFITFPCMTLLDIINDGF